MGFARPSRGLGEGGIGIVCTSRGLLSIATQEPNWSHSPSLLGPSWSPVGPMAVEVCAGPGSADAERKANRKEIAKSRRKYYKHIVLTMSNEKSKRLHEA